MMSWHFGHRGGIAEMYLIVSLAFIIVVPGSGTAQSQDSVIAPSIQYERYTDIWTCRAAIQRTWDSIQSSGSVWKDTLPKQPGEDTLPLPNIVGDVARRCAITPEQLDSNYLQERTEVLLFRHDVTSVAEGIQRYLIGSKFANVAEATIAMHSVLDAYTTIPAAPMLRYDILDTFFDRQNIPIGKQIILLGVYLSGVQRRYDTTTAEMIGGRIVSMLPGLDTIREDGSDFRSAVIGGIRARYERELRDSLRLGGVESYTRLWARIHEPAIKAGWLQTEYGRGVGVDGIGTQAASLQVSYWYPEAPPAAIPTPGTLSLIFFLDNNSYWKLSKEQENFDFFATLRRVKQRFPELDITVVSRTAGWFSRGPTVSVRDEGKIIQQWLLDTRQLPARVGIDSTPFYYLPDPDHRRVDEPSENDVNYRLGIQGTTRNMLRRGPVMFLVDSQGIIVKYTRLGRDTEDDIVDMIEILRNQTTRSQ